MKPNDKMIPIRIRFDDANKPVTDVIKGPITSIVIDKNGNMQVNSGHGVEEVPCAQRVPIRTIVEKIAGQGQVLAKIPVTITTSHATGPHVKQMSAADFAPNMMG